MYSLCALALLSLVAFGVRALPVAPGAAVANAHGLANGVGLGAVKDTVHGIGVHVANGNSHAETLAPETLGKRTPPTPPAPETPAANKLETPAADKPETPNPNAGHSLSQVLDIGIERLEPVIAALKASVAVGVEVDVKVVVVHLGHVIKILAWIARAVQGFIYNPVTFVMSLPTIVLALSNILGLILPVLVLVLAAVGAVSPTALALVTPLVAKIGGLLAQIILLVIKLAPGLLAALLPLITPHLKCIYDLRLGMLAQALGVALPA